jgi:BolA protein
MRGGMAAPFAGPVAAQARCAHLNRMPNRAERIEAVLRQNLAPLKVRVADDSRLHAGHAGAQPGGETHYSVLVVSEAFRGQTRIARSRAVHALLEAEFRNGLHALALTLRTPDEQDRATGG